MNRIVSRTEAYQNLAIAIVIQTVQDWKKAARLLQERTESPTVLAVMKDCERFLRSEWCEGLSGLNGPMILKKLKEDHGYDS